MASTLLLARDGGLFGQGQVYHPSLLLGYVLVFLDDGCPHGHLERRHHASESDRANFYLTSMT